MTDSRLLVSLIILSIVAVAAFTVAISSNNSVSHAAPGPSFNKIARRFPITTGTNGIIDNVASSNGRYEQNFLRVGESWDRQGNYSNGGDNLEVCEDGKVVTLWVYAHNTILTNHNHNNPALLDFQGTAVAKNATVSLNADNLDEDIYVASHSITATLSASNASTKRDTARIYCNDHPIALVSEGVSAPVSYSWANEPINRNRHERAKEVFGANYQLVNANQIFSQGSKIGYNGNLPACRYYAAYVKVELKVVKEEPVPEVVVPVGSTEPTPPVEEEAPVVIPALGSTNLLNYGLVVLVSGFALTLAITQRAVIARNRYNK